MYGLNIAVTVEEEDWREDTTTNVSSKSSLSASSSSVRGRVGRKYSRWGMPRGFVCCGLPVSVRGIFVVWEIGKMDNTDDELILVV